MFKFFTVNGFIMKINKIKRTQLKKIKSCYHIKENQRLIIFIGFPGSGKTTYRNTLKENFVVVSPDEIRKNKFNIVFDLNLESEVWNTVFDEIENCLCEGKSCLVDATNLNPYHRQIYIEMALEHEATPEVCFFNTPFEECLRRIRLRDPLIRIPDNLMVSMKELWDKYHINNLYSIINQLFTEGFKIVKVIDNTDNTFTEKTFTNKLN